jgi:hypothetical protein
MRIRWTLTGASVCFGSFSCPLATEMSAKSANAVLYRSSSWSQKVTKGSTTTKIAVVVGDQLSESPFRCHRFALQG